MKIAAATVSMQSQHLAIYRQEAKESLRAWVGTQRPDFEGRGARSAAAPAALPTVSISADGKAAQSSEADAIQTATEAVENDPIIQMLRRMIEKLTGKPVKVFDARELHGNGAPANLPQPAPSPGQGSAASNAPAGFGIEYDYHALREEIERTGFSAQGVVRTADGQEIRFQLDLAMARQYREETSVSVRAGDARRKDPLVINFDGKAAQLTDQRFRFDLDSDGSKEEIAQLAAGSGYLALDKNGNGVIDSGAELFGPATGSGFSELAKYDQDGNGWIDEADGVYGRLSIWTPAGEDGGTLSGLAERQVGALYLGSTATPFELRGQANSDLGAVKASGIYLSESGQAGAMQEIDLTV